jgi:hypothetical protein
MTLKLLDVLAAGRAYGPTIDEGDADPASAVRIAPVAP